MRKQHHYTTEKQILDKIDLRREQVKALNARAEQLEADSKMLFLKFKENYSTIPWQDLTDDDRNIKAVAIQHKEQALKDRKKAKRVEEVILPYLGEVLSEFRTAPMLAITGSDHSVSSLI